MQGISLLARTLSVLCVSAFLCACGGAGISQSGLPSTGNGGEAARAVPARATKGGIYVSSYYVTSVYAFKSDYKQGGSGPTCSLFTGQEDIRDIAADSKGDLIVPEGASDSVVLYGGPNLCGPMLGTISDPYGQPADAASLNAATGTIVVADFQTASKRVGNLAICTLKSGCTEMLTGSNIAGYGFGVALAKNGDCWLASAGPGSTGARMTYWPGCTGSGEAVTGFRNTSAGSLSIDKQGNLVAVDWDGGVAGQLWVYSGCDPACTVVGGPFALKGNPLFGALNARGSTFGTMETAWPNGGTVDIYRYSPTAVTYDYSFNSSYETVTYPEGFAYSPALKQ
jgi:hypothetical protein